LTGWDSHTNGINSLHDVPPDFVEAGKAGVIGRRLADSWRFFGCCAFRLMVQRGSEFAASSIRRRSAATISAGLVEPLLIIRRALREQIVVPHRRLLAIVRDDEVCRRLMTTPRCRLAVALTCRATVDVAARFRKSKAAGTMFGLACSKYESGEIDRADSEEKREPVGDINTAVADSNRQDMIWECQKHAPQVLWTQETVFAVPLRLRCLFLRPFQSKQQEWAATVGWTVRAIAVGKTTRMAFRKSGRCLDPIRVTKPSRFVRKLNSLLRAADAWWHCYWKRRRLFVTRKTQDRERGNLVTEQTRIVNQMKAILMRFDIRTFRPTLRKVEEKLDGLRTAERAPLLEKHPRGAAPPLGAATRCPWTDSRDRCDIDAVMVDRLNALDPERPIRDASSL
jgi:hypothetical protein